MIRDLPYSVIIGFSILSLLLVMIGCLFFSIFGIGIYLCKYTFKRKK